MLVWGSILSCTKTKLFEQQEYVFPGVQSLTDNNDGTFTLNWEQVPTGEVSYLVYARNENEKYNFNLPKSKTVLSTYTTSNLRFSGNTCFIVRFAKPDLQMTDENLNEKCTENDAYIFKGVASASVQDNGSIKLTWDEIPQADVSYRVFETTEKGKYDFSKILKSTTSPTADIDAFPLTTKKCFVVRYAIVDAPDDSNTNEVCPDVPYVSGFNGISSAVSNATGLATVTWSAPTTGSSHVSSYKVYLGAGLTDLKGTAAGTETSITVAGLPVDETVALGVRAVDKYGREDVNAKTISVKIANTAIPGFNGITTAVKVSGSLSAKLDWVAADGKVSTYKVYYGVGASGTTPAVSYTTPIATADGNLLTTTISGLGDDLTYCFDVRAATSSGQESNTVNVKCVTMPDGGAPAFAGITSAAFTAGGAQIGWIASISQVTNYKVFYQQGSGPINFATANFQTVSNLAPPATQQNETNILGLQDNTTYTFAVRATDSHAISDSNTASRTITSSDLTPPIFLGITNLVATDDTHLTVTFNRSTEGDMNRYSLRVRETSVGGAYTELTSVAEPGSGATVSGTISGLLPATSYDVLVKAVDTSGNVSTNTLATTRATLDLTPPTFSGVSAIGLDPGDQSKVKVSWAAATDNSGILGYKVYYSTASMSGCAASLKTTYTHPKTYAGCAAPVNISPLVTATNYYSFAALTEGATYYFIAHALDNSNTNNEDGNTVQSGFNVPYYTPPVAPGSVAIVGGNGPSAVSAITVTGTGSTGNTIKIYVNGVAGASQVINTGTSFSIPVSLSTTAGTYSITASQVNLSTIEGPQSSALSYVLQNSAPTATLSGTPCATTGCLMSANSMTGTTVGGTNVTSYMYALLFNQSTSCTIATYNGSWISIATQITDSVVGTGDGPYRLCVKGRDGAGNAQASADATIFEFTRDTVPLSPPATVSIKNDVTNSTTITYSPQVSATVATVSGASKYCVTTTNSQPAQNAACWTASTTFNVTLASTGSATVYGWTQKSSGIVSATSTASNSITYTNICDSGSLASGQTCAITTTKTVLSSDHIAGQGNMTISGSGVITGNAEERFSITLSGDFLAASGSTRINGNVTLTASNITINGTVTADGKGFQGIAANAGSPGSAGGSLGLSLNSGGGGGLGGAGGASSTGNAGGTANSSLNAAQPSLFGGSGGGNNGSPSLIPGAGGGAIKLVATGTITVDGTLSSKGNTGQFTTNSVSTGAGSGGSLWLVANLIAGSGTIVAQGGSGSGNSGVGGAGSGGAISLNATTSYFKGTLNLAAGAVGSGHAEDGKMYVNYLNPCDSGTLVTICTISGPLRWGTNQTFSIGNLIVANGGAISLPTRGQKMSIAATGDITVQSGGTILANLEDVTGVNFIINSGGTVSADGLGFYGSSGVKTNETASTGGSPNTNVANWGAIAGGASGGGHGGRGGFSGTFNMSNTNNTNIAGYAAGSAYGSFTQPVGFGGSGGGQGSASPACSGETRAIPGGGAIKISVSGTLTVNGTLSANGNTGCGVGGSSTGGGAGGSIWLAVPTLSGTGIVKANGGAGGATSNALAASGGGAGGRIAATNTNKFSGTVNAFGGLASNSAGYATAGDPGTVYFLNQDNYCSGAGTVSTTCIISQIWAFPNNFTFVGSGSLVVANGGQLYGVRSERQSINMTSNLTVQAGGIIKGNWSITAANVTVDSSGVIEADGWGYLGVWNAAGEGTGGCNGALAATQGGPGGAHGGNGGSSGSTVGGTAYGSSTSPITFGCAGGSISGALGGGSGGGAIKINVTTNLVINGTVSSVGLAGFGLYTSAYVANGTGGGAGGAVWLICSTLSGSGTVLANGGKGGNDPYGDQANTTRVGAGGGGGRIAITRSTDTFAGTRTASGGAFGTTAGSNAPNGTVVLQ